MSIDYIPNCCTFPLYKDYPSPCITMNADNKALTTVVHTSYLPHNITTGQLHWPSILFVTIFGHNYYD